ncbi:MAG TPA: N-6 DNA methylase [Chthonomonadaceae bacterium]|nr:N-6 DNA methylase [Chthonomonadaceae bacterium]
MTKTVKPDDLIQPLLINELRSPKEAFRYLRNYLAGQFIGATRDDALLDEVLKCLFCKLYIETSASEELPTDLNLPDQACFVRSVFSKVRRDFPDIYPNDAEILLDPQAICVVIRECQFSLLDAGTDPIGDAFEVFVGSEARGRSGQFFTPQTVTDFLVKAVDPRPGETIVDPACGAGGFLASVARHFRTTGAGVDELASLASRTIYGIDKDDYLVKLAKLHISLLTKGHPKIVCGDSLAMQNGATSLRDELPEEGFDVLFANPPFGTRIVAANPQVLQTFQIARRWVLDKRTGRLMPSNEMQTRVPPQVLFVERILSLLKEGGRLGIVLPESLLSNKSYRHVIEYLITKSTIHAVIGMPEALFKTSGKGGTHTKTCLVIAEKGKRNSRKTIFMAEAKWCGHDSRARTIPHNDLPQIRANFKDFEQGKLNNQSLLGFSVSHEKISNVLCPRYYDPLMNSEIGVLEKTHNLVIFKELVKRGVLSVATGDELGKLAYGTGNIPFIRTSDISNWELKADPKHGVSRKIFEKYRKKQDVQVGDILMVKDGTYLVGTCAIITEHDKEIIYQSHIYKLRVRENDFGLNPYLLLAMLSSSTVQRQIKSKQFTMDIIDSLGERLYELILPIPKSEKVRQKVSDLVKNSVDKRIEARTLAQYARQLVTQNDA